MGWGYIEWAHVEGIISRVLLCLLPLYNENGQADQGTQHMVTVTICTALRLATGHDALAPAPRMRAGQFVLEVTPGCELVWLAMAVVEVWQTQPNCRVRARARGSSPKPSDNWVALKRSDAAASGGLIEC